MAGAPSGERIKSVIGFPYARRMIGMVLKAVACIDWHWGAANEQDRSNSGDNKERFRQAIVVARAKAECLTLPVTHERWSSYSNESPADTADGSDIVSIHSRQTHRATRSMALIYR